MAHMDVFDSICYNELAKDPSNIQYINGEPVVSSSILSCPNQCSHNGNCVSGTCHCNHGFVSADCSVKVGAVPTIHRIRGLEPAIFRVLVFFKDCKELIFHIHVAKQYVLFIYIYNGKLKKKPVKMVLAIL
jgi:hypothetical protein